MKPIALNAICSIIFVQIGLFSWLMGEAGLLAEAAVLGIMTQLFAVIVSAKTKLFKTLGFRHRLSYLSNLSL